MTNIYPETIEIDNVDYEINTGYEYALACFECIDDNELSEIERAYGVIEILYKQVPPDDKIQQALKLAIKYLQCGKEENPSYKPPDMNFTQDINYIKSSFMSDYRIDLDSADMCWYKFNNLLQGLTDNCILNRIRDIRNYDLSSVKDAKTRQKIIQAQEDFALESNTPKEQQDIIDDFFSQLK